MKKLFLTMLMPMMALVALAQTDVGRTDGTNEEAVETWRRFGKTSSLVLDTKRLSLLNTIEQYSDSFPHTAFKEYLTKPEPEAEAMERAVPILYAYRAGFDKTLHEIRNTKVKKGTARIWLLYNMGFVVKTPSGSFGIDIDHRLAEQFAPYLDFLCITHRHGDHANAKLIAAMKKLGKPVLTNFDKESGKYLSAEPTSYKIGNFTIRTALDNHLANAKLPKFVTIYRIDCGEDAGNFSMVHCGDAGFNPAHFKNVQGPVNLVVLRWGAPRESNILGTGEGQVKADYAVLSHLIELRHKPYPHGQASITKTLEHLPTVKCEQTIIPFWGEQLVWRKGKLR